MYSFILLLIGAAIVVLALAWTFVTYNRFVKLGNVLQEAWSGIEVQLERRHDLIPNLVAVVKTYAAHEKIVLEEVARMRSGGPRDDPVNVAKTEQGITLGLTRLMAIVENYPELKADRNFRELQKSLSRIEDEIQMARRYYNGAVRNYNILVDSFPSLLVARLLSYAEKPFFTLESPDKAQVPVVSFA